LDRDAKSRDSAELERLAADLHGKLKEYDAQYDGLGTAVDVPLEPKLPGLVG
jgi:hypothetical protein